MTGQTDKKESETCQTYQSQTQHTQINLYQGSLHDSFYDHDSLTQESCCFKHCLCFPCICHFDNDLN